MAPPEARHAIDVIRDIDTRLSLTPTSKQTGLMVKVKVNLSDWSSSPSALMLKRLSDIDHLTGSTSITALILGCVVAKSSEVKPLTSATFFSTINAFPILDSTLLRDISFSLTVGRSDPATPLNTQLKLTGQLVLGVFNAEKPWTSIGTLTIDKSKNTAELVVARADQEQSMVELGVIKLGNIDLHVTYTFGQPSVSCDTSLSADVKVGSHVVKGAVTFKGSRPSLLRFSISGTLQVGELFQTVIASNFPKDFIELSLTDLDFCYSWNPKTLDVRPKPIEPGLTASARTDVFGELLLRYILDMF